VTKAKAFHIGDVISTVKGVLVAPRGIEAVYDVLKFLTGADHWTHQLPRASRQIAPFVFHQHPWLETLDVSSVNRETWRAWLDEQIAARGETVELSPLSAGAYEGMDPLGELMSMTDKPIVAVAHD
jgi:hypothetical protein